MNHISKSFASSDGRVYRSHSWEGREDDYRRAALIVGNGLWPANKETRLVAFLLERGFRVLSLEIAFGSPQAPRIRLGAFREAIISFAREAMPRDLPVYLVASSFSASALLPVASEIPGIAALALVSPIVEFPPPGLKMPFFFLPTAELSIERDALSGTPDCLDELIESAATLKFHKSDLKLVASDVSRALERPLGLPVAAFAGEDDPRLSQAGRRALSGAGAKVYSYPSAKGELGHDRCADDFFGDLGSFFDDLESGKASGAR